MEKRNAYLEKLDQNLSEFNTKLDKMKVKAAEVQDDLKAEYHSKVEDLETKRDSFSLKFGHLKESSGSAWNDLLVGTERSWSELKHSFEKAVTHFK